MLCVKKNIDRTPYVVCVRTTDYVKNCRFVAFLIQFRFVMFFFFFFYPVVSASFLCVLYVCLKKMTSETVGKASKRFDIKA